MGLFLIMICNKKIFNKFLFLSLIFLLATVCCDVLFVSASTHKETIRTQDPIQSVQVQQKTIIDHLNRIEHKLEQGK